MKLHIDTDAKTIKIEGEANLEELFQTLEKLFPNGNWKEYRLEQNNIINGPIIIREKEYFPNPVWPVSPSPVYPYYPTTPWPPIITCASSTTFSIGNSADRGYNSYQVLSNNIPEA